MKYWAACALALVIAFGLATAHAQTPATTEQPYLTTDAMVPVGDHTLSVRLYAPAGHERHPVILMVPGSGLERTADSVYMQIHARALAERGIGALAYDKRGSGASTGVFTGVDFASLGEDAAALTRYARALPQVEAVGLWGISQAGWVIPYTVREEQGLSFAILVSPAGVNPHEQVTYFLHRQALSWGLTQEEADATERMHRAVALYYAGRNSYRAAQAEVDSRRGARWFHGVITHPYWDEMTPQGAILDPSQLDTAMRERPNAFEIYMAPSSFMDYRRVYRALRTLPTLVIYGGSDELVPTERSRAVIESALRGERRHAHEFRLFDGASHDIQTPEGHVRDDYLVAMADWARANF